MEQGEAFVEMELHQAWASMAKSGPKHQHRAFASSSPAMVSKDESIRSGPESEQNPDFFIYYTTILNPGNRQPFANSYELFYMYCIQGQGDNDLLVVVSRCCKHGSPSNPPKPQHALLHGTMRTATAGC